MDITPVFKATVMAVKLRKKSAQPTDKNRILQTRPKDEFSKQAKDVSSKITSFKSLLLENCATYIKFASHLKGHAEMTDEQRDLIDRESEKFHTFFTQHLAQMRAEWRQSKKKKQQIEHINNVIDLLANYLKCVHNLHLEQKKRRAHHELESYDLIKLSSDRRKIPVTHGSDRKKVQAQEISRTEVDDDLMGDWQMEEDVLDQASTSTQNTSSGGNNKRMSTQSVVALDEDIQKSQEIHNGAANDLFPEDVQLFESENAQLLHELQGLSEEVERIEKNVVDIARLQEIFTEKVSVQKHDIERIANAVVGATENVKDANEQIKEAIQRNAGLRVWALFFLLVMSFTLLFLDWYND